MTWRGLLVSVRDAAEAAAALEGGASIIDVKDPAAGSLGAAPARVVANVAAAVSGRLPHVPWTVAAGELQDELNEPGRTLRWLDAIADTAGPAGPPRPGAIKFGLAGLGRRGWQRDFCRVMRQMPVATARVAVAYADWPLVDAPPPLDVVAAAVDAGCSVLLVDTADKSREGLLGACREDALETWADAARSGGLALACAGQLRIADIPLLGRFRPDVIAMRSAVCSNGRSGPVEATLVRRAAIAVAHLEKASHATTGDSRAPHPGP